MNASQDNPDSQFAGSGPNRKGPEKLAGRRDARHGGTAQSLALAMVVVAGVLFVIGIMITPSAKKPSSRTPPKTGKTQNPLAAAGTKTGKPQTPFAATGPMAANAQKPFVPAPPPAAPLPPLPRNPPASPTARGVPIPAPVDRKPSPLSPAAPVTPNPAPKLPALRPNPGKEAVIPLEPRPPAARLPVQPPVVRPPVQPPVERPPVQTPLADQFAIDVYSRITKIQYDTSFPADDSILGQMAEGDLKAQVVFSGTVLPKGRFTLEWQLDGISPGPKPALLNQVVEYNAEPTVGSYKVILRLDRNVLKTFTFRITRAQRSRMNRERLP